MIDSQIDLIPLKQYVIFQNNIVQLIPYVLSLSSWLF